MAIFHCLGYVKTIRTGNVPQTGSGAILIQYLVSIIYGEGGIYDAGSQRADKLTFLLAIS